MDIKKVPQTLEVTAAPAAAGTQTDARTGMQAADLRQATIDHLRCSVGVLVALARPHDYYRALALAVRDRMQYRWINTSQTYLDVKRKIACYPPPCAVSVGMCRPRFPVFCFFPAARTISPLPRI